MCLNIKTNDKLRQTVSKFRYLFNKQTWGELKQILPSMKYNLYAQHTKIFHLIERKHLKIFTIFMSPH